MKRINYVSFLSSLAVCLLLVVSCGDDRFGTNQEGESSIRIAVSGVCDSKAVSSPESGERIDSFVIEDSDGESMLVEAFVSDYTDLPFQLETRGSVASTASINTAGSQFIINAWLGSENRYDGTQDGDGRVYCPDDATDYHFIKNGKASRDDSKWSFKDSGGNDYIWRNNVPTTFWSYYPESVSSNVTRSITLPGNQASDDDQKIISFSYSIGASAAATDLKDLIFAYNLGQVEYEDADNADHGRLKSGSETVDIHFYHALPAIRFDVSGLVRKGKVIQSITLENLISSGSCDAVAAGGTFDKDSFHWTLGSGKATVRQTFSTTDFTESSVDNNPSTGSKDSNTLQAFSNDKIFFPLPQPIKGSGVKVTIEYAHSGDDVVVTKSFVLDHDEEWLPGKYYTYRLSVSGVDLYVNDKVTDNVKSDLVIKNIGAEPAYIRAVLAGNWVNKDGDILLEWDPEDTSVGTIIWGSGISAWEKGADGFYYHKAVVAPGEPTSQLFESYTVTSRPSILEDSDYLEFIITAHSVLADEGKASAIAAWGSTAAGYLDN